MSMDEILTRISDLEKKRFYLSMKDHWTADDFSLDSHYNLELLKLRRQERMIGYEAD